jgi:hypothetical protein
MSRSAGSLIPRGGLAVLAVTLAVALASLPAEAQSELRDVDVLTARVDPTEGGERAGVLRHKRDLHPATSCMQASQSSRNRTSP